MNTTLGERIKQARVARNMTQDELAKAVGTSKQNIYKYENGIITNIPLERVELLGNALLVNPVWLMGWSNSMHEKKLAVSKMVRDRVSAELGSIDTADFEAARESMNVEILEQIADGDGAVSVDDAVEASDLLGITLNDMLGIEEPASIDGLSEQEQQFIRVFSRLTPENRELLVETALKFLQAQGDSLDLSD